MSSGKRRYEISERFAGPRPCLDQCDPTLGEHAVDCFGHFDLARAIFVVGMMLGDQPAWSKNFFHNARFVGSGRGVAASIHPPSVTTKAANKSPRFKGPMLSWFVRGFGRACSRKWGTARTSL